MKILLLALALGSSLLACRTNETSPATPAGSTAAPNASSLPAIRSANAALDALDSRTPVPLLPMLANHQKQNMRDHLAAVQEIVAAVASKDFAGIEHSAARIGYSERMGAMCSHMGAGAPGFTETALNFHRTADTIVDAAKHRDLQGVLTALDHTLATCTNCHASFKQQVVDDETWTRPSKPLDPASPVNH